MTAGSVLAGLTAQVMQEKTTAARQLTPVEGEKRPALMPTTKASFPNDVPQEVVEQQVKELDRVIKHLGEARDALAALVAAPAVADDTSEAEQKQREFEADMRAKERAAQEAAFESNAISIAVEDGKLEIAEIPGDWICPVHDKVGIEKTSPKTGSTFIGCPDCNQFKR